MPVREVKVVMLNSNGPADTHSPEWRLAEYCSRLAYSDLPRDVIARSELLLADVTACMLLAAGDNQFRSLAKQISVDSCGRASAIGAKSISPEVATQINAMAAHWCEWDDVYDDGALHVMAVVVPTLLAAASAKSQESNLARDFVTSLVAAIDISCRIGKTILPGLKTGWMPTGIACAIGAAAGAAKLQGATSDVIADAMGLAAAACGAGRQPLVDMVNGKSVLCGQVALNAFSAAKLALAGVRGGIHYLTGPFAVEALFLDREVKFGAMSENLGRVFTLDGVKLKQYPCCRATHEAIEAALRLRAESSSIGLWLDDIDQIKSITVSVSSESHALCGAPYSEGTDGRVGKQFSIAYLVAVVLILGDVTPIAYTACDSECGMLIKGLAKKVNVVPSKNKNDQAARPQLPGMEIVYENGELYKQSSTPASVEPINEFELVKKKLSFVDPDVLKRAKGIGLFDRDESVEVDIESLVARLGAVS